MKKISSYLSVDCVVFGFDSTELRVLLIERQYKTRAEKIRNDLKLPGSMIYDQEDLYAAAIRILNELTGLSNVYLRQFHTFGASDRIRKSRDKDWLSQKYNIREIKRIISVGYYALIDINRVIISDKAYWIPVNEIRDLPFDHSEIINTALQILRQQLKTEPIGFELLPEKFTLRQLQDLYEAIMGVKYDNRNFRKKVLKSKFIIALNEKERNATRKPAQMYTFTRDRYLEERNNDYGFAF